MLVRQIALTPELFKVVTSVLQMLNVSQEREHSSIDQHRNRIIYPETYELCLNVCANFMVQLY